VARAVLLNAFLRKGSPTPMRVPSLLLAISHQALRQKDVLKFNHLNDFLSKKFKAEYYSHFSGFKTKVAKLLNGRLHRWALVGYHPREQTNWEERLLCKRVVIVYTITGKDRCREPCQCSTSLNEVRKIY